MGSYTNYFCFNNSFDVDWSRQYQDVGLDGLRDVDERVFFDTAYIQNESTYGVNSDAYNIALLTLHEQLLLFLGDDLDNESASILKRYEYFSGVDGNSAMQSNSNHVYYNSKYGGYKF